MATCRQRIAAATRWTLLTLTVMLVVAWPLTKWWEVTLVLPRNIHVSLHAGWVQFMARLPPDSPRRAPRVGLHISEEEFAPKTGLNWRFEHIDGTNAEWVNVPLWTIVPAFGAATALAWRGRVLLHRRRRRGACVSCGYDRRGLTAMTACPECGSISTVRPPA